MTRAELPEKEVKKMTREEAIKNHRKMWRWLAKNPEKWKTDYLEKFDPEADLDEDCYLCEYVAENHNGICRSCPVAWPGGTCHAPHRGLYFKWIVAKGEERYSLSAELARQIAELPEKER